MAEPVGLASAILALATFAFNSSISLYNDVKSFRSHPKQVRDLLEELYALNGVLGMLMETVDLATNVDLSALEIPLQRCSDACKEFGEELVRCCTRSSEDRTSFRDWARLKYMGDGIDGFRQQLASYKSTIDIALTDATLRTSSVTTKTLESHKELIKNATDDLETHLQNIDEKLEAIFERTVTASDADAAELRRIKNERLSTQKGLQICRQLSDHINEIQLSHAMRGEETPRLIDSGPSPNKVVNESLQECTDSLELATAQLEGYTRKLMDRLMIKSRSAMSEEEVVDLERLRGEWETAQQSMNICLRAGAHLHQNVSVIENYATGDETVQFMASTNEKTINGKNKGFGWRQTQIGGHYNDETIQQLSKDAFRASPRDVRKDESEHPSRSSSRTHSYKDKSVSKFSDRWGEGHKLTSRLSDHSLEPDLSPDQNLPSDSPTSGRMPLQK